jgi:hypothetical protein
VKYLRLLILSVTEVPMAAEPALSSLRPLDRVGAETHIASMAKRHYVYLLLRPDGEPFYVGKGTRGSGTHRVFQHEAEARGLAKNYKVNIIRKIWALNKQLGYAIDRCSDNETEILAHERSLIALYGRHDLKRGPLSNLTDGGEGASNPSEESRQARRETLWGDGGDDLDRATANRFFQKLISVQSVPIKPVEKLKIEPLFPINKKIGPSPRQAGALAASAIANRVTIEPHAQIPRFLVVEGRKLVIENGVGRDVLKTGLATLSRTHSVTAACSRAR